MGDGDRTVNGTWARCGLLQPRDGGVTARDIVLANGIGARADGQLTHALHRASPATTTLSSGERQPPTQPSPGEQHPSPEPFPEGNPGRIATSRGLAAATAAFAASMLKFAAAGFKTVDAPLHELRMGQCQSCEHRRDSQCSLCRCFIDKKAWLPHEDCPIGRWPA